MKESIAHHLAWVFGKGIPDRRNGSYVRTVLTELGAVILPIPRTRLFSPKDVIEAYARRSRQVDELILVSFLLGFSTRKVASGV